MMMMMMMMRRNIRMNISSRMKFPSGTLNREIHSDIDSQRHSYDQLAHVKIQHIVDYTSQPEQLAKFEIVYWKADCRAASSHHGKVITRGVSSNDDMIMTLFSLYSRILRRPATGVWLFYKDFAQIPFITYMQRVLAIDTIIMHPSSPMIVKALMIKLGFEESEDHVALMIRLHGKMGDIPSYTSVFARLGNKGLAAWKSLFMAHVDNLPGQAISTFAHMEAAGFKPDLYMCRSILAAYVRSNAAVGDASEFLRKISSVYKLTPTTVEYSCLVDKILKSEGLEKAVEEVEKTKLISDEICNMIFAACTTRVDDGQRYNVYMAGKMAKVVASVGGKYQLSFVAYSRLESSGFEFPPNITSMEPRRSLSNINV